MVLPTGDSAPDRYTSRYITPQGVYVDVTFHTDNKVIADQYEADIANKTGWVISDEYDEGTESKAYTILGIWLFAVLGVILVPSLCFFAGIVLHAADWGTFSATDTWLKWGLRVSLIFFPIAAILLTVATLFNKPSQE